MESKKQENIELKENEKKDENQNDLKKLITKVDNRVKTKVYKNNLKKGCNRD